MNKFFAIETKSRTITLVLGDPEGGSGHEVASFSSDETGSSAPSDVFKFAHGLAATLNSAVAEKTKEKK